LLNGEIVDHVKATTRRGKDPRLLPLTLTNRPWNDPGSRHGAAYCRKTKQGPFYALLSWTFRWNGGLTIQSSFTLRQSSLLRSVVRSLQL
jgi:hypothetical protein